MSVIYAMIFIFMLLSGSYREITHTDMVEWALFAIADALLVAVLWR